MIAKYWFMPECPACKKPAEAVKWGEPVSFEELKSSIDDNYGPIFRPFQS